jgi:hypothetical protein
MRRTGKHRGGKGGPANLPPPSTFHEAMLLALAMFAPLPLEAIFGSESFVFYIFWILIATFCLFYLSILTLAIHNEMVWLLCVVVVMMIAMTMPMSFMELRPISQAYAFPQDARPNIGLARAARTFVVINDTYSNGTRRSSARSGNFMVAPILSSDPSPGARVVAVALLSDDMVLPREVDRRLIPREYVTRLDAPPQHALIRRRGPPPEWREAGVLLPIRADSLRRRAVRLALAEAGLTAAPDLVIGRWTARPWLTRFGNLFPILLTYAGLLGVWVFVVKSGPDPRTLDPDPRAQEAGDTPPEPGRWYGS